MIASPQYDSFSDDLEGFVYLIRSILVRDLQIDPSYQREPKPGHVKNIVDNFDPYLLDPLVVSRRSDGSSYVMDGQHRLLALRQMGYDDQLVPCLVFENLTVQQESRRFNTQDTRKQLTAIERFRARLLEGQSAEMAVNQAVNASGFRIDFAKTRGSNTVGAVSCVAALLQVYRAGGAGHVREVMTAIAGGYGLGICPDAQMVGGMSTFMRRYDGSMNVVRLVTVMRETAPEQIAREAKNIQSALKANGKTAYAMALLPHYNRNLRNRLPDFHAAAPPKKSVAEQD